VAVRVTRLPISSVLRAQTTGEIRGFMKALIDARSDRILGFTMFGPEAGEVMPVVQTAMLAGMPYTGLRDAPAEPQRYQLYVNTMPVKNLDAKNAISLMAHVPENAMVWVQGQQMSTKGKLRHFESPPVTADQRYVYTVRVDWVEDGKRVSETQKFPVKAGDIQCVYLMHGEANLERDAEAKTNLAKLSEEDRKLAQEQRSCAVQDKIRLGAMGVPVKVMLNGQPVMLCCEACSERAKSKPEQTLAKVKELKEKAAAAAPK